MLHLQRRTLDAVGAARLRSGVGHVETVGVMDGYGSYPYYSSTKIRKLHLCYAKNVHQPWPLALKCDAPYTHLLPRCARQLENLWGGAGAALDR